jgi:midasin
VLDRINSLAEPDGSIVISECGLVEGKPVILHAHPRFRMFLTVNPQYGEVSRAMRNRGVEIFLLEKYGSLGDELNQNQKGNLRMDVSRFLTTSGIARCELVSAMTDAHMFAKETGSRLGVHISLLELTRWVHLFQQLLMKGNRLMWSLHLSWEHTYLPSLGEIEGIEMVLEGKSTFLTGIASGYSDLFLGYSMPLLGGLGKSKLLTGFSGGHSDLLLGYSLALPGGWPSPLKLRDFVWYSREACVRNNCMFLESLGAQYAAYELSRCCTGTKDAVWKNRNIHYSVMPVCVINQLLFPEKVSKSENILSRFDTGLANQMLFFAVNWVIEQISDKDLFLYRKWFEHYGSQFGTFCKIFSSFSKIFEGRHGCRIWERIFLHYREVISHFEIDTDAYPLPFLSSKLMKMTSSDNALKSCHASLGNALDSFKLYLLSLQQWNSEKCFSDKKKVENLFQLLKSLRVLERKVLSEIMEQEVCDIYSDIIEYHSVLWKSLVSSRLDYLSLAWSFLEKEVTKLSSRFPVQVRRLMVSFLPLKHQPCDFDLISHCFPLSHQHGLHR